MPTPAHPPSSDRNLLFGILALQMDFISRDALIQAMNAWVLDKNKPLGHILRGQGQLSEQRLVLLEALVKEHLQAHDNDAQRSLAAVSAPASVHQELRSLADGDVQASLDSVSAAHDTDAGATGPYQPRPERANGEVRYRVLRPHAKGGLGEVFVAEDTELHREVALKEIRAHYAHDAHSRNRFLLEAEITGGLEHPAIVPVYGLGRHEDGRPYYAMRFIQGDTLKEAIHRFHEAETRGRDPGERALALRKLLGQFVTVCNAVAYAHSRGVLNRDIKDDNVMLGKFGETLVIDWGLAKVVGRLDGAEGNEGTIRPFLDDLATQMGSAIGTPAYMSPEAAEGRLDLMGRASDIYSLGATLYKLLTGQPPIQGQDRGAIMRKASRGEWLPPCQVTKDVPPALDAICRKAMALKPAQRYASVLDLAADVEHWLADEPVQVYREPWLARLGRWRRRHPAWTATVVVLLLALAGAGAWLGWQRAEAEGAISADLDAVAHRQEEGRWTEARTALAKAEGRLGPWVGRHWDQRVRQTRQDLDLVARLEDIRLQRSQVREGHFDNAGPDLAYAAAFTTYGLPVLEGDVDEIAARVAASTVRGPLLAALDDWATYKPKADAEGRRRLRAVAQRADPNPWGRQLRAALDQPRRQALEALASQPEATDQPPATVVALAYALVRQGAGVHATELLAGVQRRHPDDFWINHQLGFHLMEMKPPQTAEAVGYYRAALALRPDSPGVYVNLGLALDYQGRHKEAQAAHRRAIQLKPDYATAHNNLGIALDKQGRLKEAEAAYRQAIQLKPDYAQAHNNLGPVLGQQGRLKEAEAACRRAIALKPDLADAHHNLGVALYYQGRHQEAEAAHRKAIELQPDHANAHSHLGHDLSEQRRYKEAEDAYRQAIKLQPDNALAHYNLGQALREQGRYKEAEAAYRQAIQLKPDYALAYVNLGDVLRRQGRYRDSLGAYQRAHQLGIQRPNWRYPSAAWVRDAQRMANLEDRLPDLLAKKTQPADADEAVVLAKMCQDDKHLYAAGARFFAAAFALKPALADDLRAGHCYNAACAAALAAAGQGQDAANLDAKEKARLRQQALDWLRTDLAAWSKRLAGAKPDDRATIQQTLKHWQQDPDLTGVRDSALEKLPEAERPAWRQLWADVGVLLHKAIQPKEAAK